MKAINLITGLVLVLLVSACGSSRLAGPGVYYDDIYYVPGSTRENIQDAFSPVPAISKDAQKVENRNLVQQQKEYQNIANPTNSQDTRDFSAIQEEYAALLSDTSTQDLDTLVYYNDETGYWVDGFDGSAIDREYAERLIRFQRPFIGIPYYSPLYNDLVYFNHFDYNVYVDGNYAYAFPSWSSGWNNFYFGYGYSSPYWYYGNNWGYPYGGYWGFNSFWGMDYGWGSPFGYPYYNHYSPYCGYNDYYGYGYGYGGGYGGGYGYGSGNFGGGDGGRPINHHTGMNNDLHSNTRPVVGSRMNSREILKRTSGESTVVTNGGSRISRDQQGNTRYENENGTVYSRNSRGGGSQESLKSGEVTPEGSATRPGSRTGQTSNTRKSYTPSYSKPADNTRPTYNRASYTRITSDRKPSQTTGTVQSPGRGTSQVQGSRLDGSNGSGTSPRVSNPNVNSSRPQTTSPGSRMGTESSGTNRQTRPAVAPSNTRPSSGTNYREGSGSSRPNSSPSYSPSRSSSNSTPSRSSGMGSESRSSSSGSSSGSSSSGSSYSPSSSGSSGGSGSSGSSGGGGGTIRQGRR